MKKPDYISEPDWQLLKEKYPDNLEKIVEKLNNDYPVQYLIGNVEFLNTIIKVDERVLIPRFETEILVDKTIKYAKNKFDKCKILDLGTGSGCIAISLKKNLNCEVTAVDISSDALSLAKENALDNHQDINFINQDMLKIFGEKYDIIISNPPYIKNDGFVEKKVLLNEPHIALFAEDNGLYFYKNILQNHFKNLNNPGLIAFEIGDNQVNDLTKFLKELKITNYKFENDLAGMPRYLFIFNE